MDASASSRAVRTRDGRGWMNPRARATTRKTTTTTRETTREARGIARSNANDGPFAVEEARGTLVTLATEIKREMTTTARDDERDDERGAARETRRAIEAMEKRDEEEEEETTTWTTFGVRADDGSTARLSKRGVQARATGTCIPSPIHVSRVRYRVRL